MTTKQIDRQTFLALVRQSGLIAGEQLAQIAKELPETNRGRVVARALVERGLLTRFQAEVLLAGRTSGFVLGQYRILDQLGQGGMGRVFKAVHVAMNRVVALKVLSPSLMKTERAQQMFLREVRAAGRLIHPNIVTAYDADKAQNSDRYYLVMEFVDGPNLDQLIREQGPLPVAEACDLIRQAANGLQYAFELGMVHRDIKPANLLVQRAGGRNPKPQYAVKILDFGLARLHEPDQQLIGDSIGSIVTGENTVMGTPDYLSPEQARDLHRVDIRSDIYSLGCTFYYLLTGQVPHPGGSTMEKLVRHSTEEPEPVEQLRPEVPQPVAAIVRRMMARDPAARFQTPAEAAAALTPFARVGSGDWSLPDLHAPSVEATLTPPGSLEPAADSPFDMGAVPATNREEWAIGTVPPDLGTVPLGAQGMPSLQLRRSVQEEQRRRLLLARGVTVAGLGLVVLVGAVLIWALSR
jgi:serine/threonine-protein kinase